MSLEQFIKSIVPMSTLPVLRNIYLTTDFFSIMGKKILGLRYLKLRLDTNNTCNMRCKFCYTLITHSLNKVKSRIMSIDEFRKIADELFPRSTFIALSCAWEPLMNKHFVDYINIAAEYRTPYLFFVTNGKLFTDEVIKASIKAPVHEIAISIHAANNALYEEIMGSASFDRVINNLKRIYDLKKENNSVYPKVRINFIVFEQNSSDAPLFIMKYQKYFNAIYINHLVKIIGDDSDPYTRMSKDSFNKVIRQCKKNISDKSIGFNYHFNPVYNPPVLCSTALKHISISSNGDVRLCNQKTIGNIYTNSYKEIFEANKRLLSKMYFGKDYHCRKKCGT